MTYLKQYFSFSFVRTATLALLAVGIYGRLLQFIFNRSLWLDEAMLANTVLDHSYLELLHPVNFEIAKPIGFLWMTKGLVDVIGNHDWTFRLIPCFSGVASLLLFYRFLKKYSYGQHILVGLTLFVVSYNQLRYSSEFMPYSLDILAALALQCFSISLLTEKFTLRHALTLCLWGTVALWVSFPSVFVLGGLGLTLMSLYVTQRRWPEMRNLFFCGLIWALNLIFLYAVFLRRVEANQNLQSFWQNSFMPLSFHSAEEIFWPLISFVSIFYNPGCMKYNLFGFLAFLMGCYILGQKNIWRLAILIGPIILAMLASALHKYPFADRLLLFFIPAMYFLINDGMVFLLDLGSDLAKGLYIFFLIIILAEPVMTSANFFTNSLIREEIKPVLASMNQHMKKDDVIYVYHGAIPAFRYYRDFFGMGQYKIFLGRSAPDHWEDYQKDIDPLKDYPRVWFVFSHLPSGAKNDEVFFINYLNSIGTVKGFVIRPGTGAYLYDLGNGRENY